MKKSTKLWISILAVVFLLLSYRQFYSTKAVEIKLGSTEFSLKYSVIWGWNMTEYFTLKRREALIPISIISNDIFKKPYNSGASIYLTKDHKSVILGHWWGVILIDIITGQMERFCSINLVNLTDNNIKKLATDSLFGEFKIIQSSLNDKLLYLGRFEVIKYQNSSSGRYDDVAFKTATISPESEYDLSGKCG